MSANGTVTGEAVQPATLVGSSDVASTIGSSKGTLGLGSVGSGIEEETTLVS